MNDDRKELKVLFVENNSFLTHNFEKLVKSKEEACIPPVSIQVTTARHIEAAVNHMEKQQFDAVLLDIMLPLNEEKLKRLEELEQERKLLMKQLLRFSNEERVEELSIEIEKIRRRIDEIDDIIDNDIQDIEGGYHILKKYMDSHEMKTYNKAVMFISARGQLELKDKCRKMANSSSYAWLEKPISELDIIKKMLNLCKIKYSDVEFD